MKNILIGCVVVVFLVVLSLVFVSNRIISLDQTSEEKLANVKTALQRRYDLIPNLVATVKGYAKHESETFEQVTAARARVGQFTLTPELLRDPEQLKAFQAAQSQLSSALTKLFAVSEQYPQLRASENFLALQAQIEGTENRIKVERDNYNKAVRDYNTAIRQFPGSLVAGSRTVKQFFEITNTDVEKSPSVTF